MVREHDVCSELCVPSPKVPTHIRVTSQGYLSSASQVWSGSRIAVTSRSATAVRTSQPWKSHILPQRTS
ncbi:hypothetical protein NDU88_005015 [Pleurodeles waltl]|uniref:Uncharacterized protein n=1 Tax=Pleurodeles waltl TaxID=8319 RepID=A0AAV7TA23_PLEWA|nr:hypothetical protein NDU88_005015 [Pleurodeles waltl]